MPGSFAEVRDEFLRITGDVVWCTVATVDTRGRPRTRILHPIWEVIEDRPVGWIGTTRSPLKTRHLAANPYVSCGYWSPAQETVYADCRAAWADGERERVWRMFVERAPAARLRPVHHPHLDRGAARRRLGGPAARPLAGHGADRRGPRGGTLVRPRLARAAGRVGPGQASASQVVTSERSDATSSCPASATR